MITAVARFEKAFISLKSSFSFFCFFVVFAVVVVVVVVVIIISPLLPTTRVGGVCEFSLTRGHSLQLYKIGLTSAFLSLAQNINERKSRIEKEK